MIRVTKKIREADFFLRKLHERSLMAFGNKEEFDYYLSAFLSASRSVDYRLRHEQTSTYKAFFASWHTALSPEDRAFLKFMVDDRNLEVHQSGSIRVEADVREAIGSSYSDASGTVTIAAPPGTPAAEIVKQTFVFILNNRSVPVLDCCSRYLRILQQLVVDYGRHIGAV